MTPARQRILDAFRDLVLSQPYADITVSRVIERAGTARSTHYAHFPDKRSLLLASMASPLEALASCATTTAGTDAVIAMLDHAWDNRVLGRTLLDSPDARHVADALANLIARKSSREHLHGTLTCHAVAGGYLTVLRRWLAGEIICDSVELAAWFTGWRTNGM
ncbi:MAG: helix-turn-helix domain-containing protein [Pseudomonadales bacterium]|nr:TetR family transcriptional regulator [Pseudomonadales bacterium]